MANSLHHDFPGINREVGVVKRPIELLLCLRLIGRVVVWGEVWVSKSLLSLDTFPGVEDQHVLKKIDGCELSECFHQDLS